MQAPRERLDLQAVTSRMIASMGKGTVCPSDVLRGSAMAKASCLPLPTVKALPPSLSDADFYVAASFPRIKRTITGHKVVSRYVTASSDTDLS